MRQVFCVHVCISGAPSNNAEAAAAAALNQWYVRCEWAHMCNTAVRYRCAGVRYEDKIVAATDSLFLGFWNLSFSRSGRCLTISTKKLRQKLCLCERDYRVRSKRQSLIHSSTLNGNLYEKNTLGISESLICLYTGDSLQRDSFHRAFPYTSALPFPTTSSWSTPLPPLLWYKARSNLKQ